MFVSGWVRRLLVVARASRRAGGRLSCQPICYLSSVWCGACLVGWLDGCLVVKITTTLKIYGKLGPTERNSETLRRDTKTLKNLQNQKTWRNWEKLWKTWKKHTWRNSLGETWKKLRKNRNSDDEKVGKWEKLEKLWKTQKLTETLRNFDICGKLAKWEKLEKTLRRVKMDRQLSCGPKFSRLGWRRERPQIHRGVSRLGWRRERPQIHRGASRLGSKIRKSVENLENSGRLGRNWEETPKLRQTVNNLQETQKNRNSDEKVGKWEKLEKLWKTQKLTETLRNFDICGKLGKLWKTWKKLRRNTETQTNCEKLGRNSEKQKPWWKTQKNSLRKTLLCKTWKLQ